MIREKQLEMLGLHDKEARLYLAALSSKPFTVAGISLKSGIKRPTCYIILDELSRRGLISIVPQARKRLYKAEPPEALIRQAKRALSYAERFVPSLRGVYQEGKESSAVKYYYGQKGIQNIYEDILDSGDKVIYNIISSKHLVETAGEDFMKDYIERRVESNARSISIRMRETESEDHIFHGGKELLRDIRYAPKGFFIPTSIFMYADRVAIIATAKSNFGLIIENKEIHDTVRSLFDVLWGISTEK